MSLFEFYRLLQRHDWSYNYSDDHRVWQKGMDEANMIQHILKCNSRDEKYRNLYEKYREWFWDTSGDVVKPDAPEEV